MSGMYEIRRTPEQGHTAPCLAKAMIAAIENYRDALVDDANRLGDSTLADLDFRLAAQRNDFLRTADEYLVEGMTECLCPRVETPGDGPNPTLAAAARNLAAARERAGRGVSAYGESFLIEGEVVNEEEDVP